MGYITRMKIPNILHIQWCAVPAISKIQLCFSALHKISKRGKQKRKRCKSREKATKRKSLKQQRLINFQACPVYELMFWQRGKTSTRGVSRLLRLYNLTEFSICHASCCRNPVFTHFNLLVHL